LLVLIACQDKAKPALDQCTELLAKGDALGAQTACQSAVTADSASKAGTAAAMQVTAMQPEVLKAQLAKAEAEADARLVAEEGAKARWQTMPKTIRDRLYACAADDLRHGRATKAMDLITQTIGQQRLHSYEGGMSMVHVWGKDPGSRACMDEAKQAPLMVRIRPGLTCGDYTSNQVEFWSYGQRI
jgi:hypothetical protein